MSKRIRFCILLAIFAGLVLFYGNHLENTRKLEQARPPLVGNITIYTDIPSNVSLPLAKQYQETYHVKVEVLPLTETQLADKLADPKQLKDGDIVISSAENLQVGVKNNRFMPIINPRVDLVSTKFKNPDDFWVGIWYDPIVFVEKITNKTPIRTWKDLLTTEDKQIVIPDFAATRTAGNILYSFVEIYGQENTMEFFKELKPHIAQHTKYVETAERLVALGEIPIGIGTYSDSKLYAKKDYHIRTIYPQDNTPYMLTGAALLADSSNTQTGKNFIVWLLSKDIPKKLDSQEIYYVYTNPEIKKEQDDFGADLKLMDTKSEYNDEGKAVLLDEWIKVIRF